jgi:Rps23 Pro-64 3,4-dihydroxylase Tpa1-like proline 4-hydroxylase
VKLDRDELARHMLSVMARRTSDLASQWRVSAPVNHFVVDDLLPEEWVRAIRSAFPRPEAMVLKRSLRELKYVSAQMNRYDSLLEEIVYAFQAPGIVSLVEQITALQALEADSMLYAGGISVMAPGHFLNPHVDNSHDRPQQKYRVLNLLYYVSPDWSESDGGNLELWPTGPKGQPITIVSKFNRLVVMITHRQSWHSVSRSVGKADRCCVSNYYFSEHPPIGSQQYSHVTSFRGRPEQPLRDLVLRGDNWLRTIVGKAFPTAIKSNRHYYKKEIR